MAELYSLPNGWEWKKLRDKVVCELIMGQSPSSDTYNSDGIGIPFFQGKTEFGEIYPRVSKYCTTPNKIAQIGDILLSVRAPVGPTNIANIECCIGRGLGAIRPNSKNTLTNYLLYFFRNFEIEISNKGKGSTFPAITKKELEEINIPLPPLEEQKRIVAKLDILFEKIDKAIALHQKNIDEADIFMASVLNDVFVELEEKYGKQLLLDGVYIGCKKGFKPTIINGKVPFIGMSDIDEHNGINTKYVMEDYENVSNGKTKFEKNAVLVGKITPCTQNNKTTIVPSNIDGGFATTEVYALHSMSNMNPYYLNHFMRSKEVNEFLVSTMVGATGRQRVPSESIKNLQISIPPLKTQQKVVSYLDEISQKMEKIKNLQKKKMQSLKELKASILDKVFKGEL